MNYRTYHSLLFEHFLDCSKTNLKMNAINSIILCWSFLTITEIGATKMMVKRGGQEPLRPFLTNQSMDDFRNKKLLLARRVTLEQKVRNPKLRNVLAIVLQKKKQRLATCTRNFNCFKTAKDTNRLNRFKNYHHWFFYCWSKIKKICSIFGLFWFKLDPRNLPIFNLPIFDLPWPILTIEFWQIARLEDFRSN